MGKKSAVPDAWDDDWETQADKAEVEPKVPELKEEPKITRAERQVQHAESNKKLWQSADEPETFHFLAAREPIPLKSEFKPALKVLSRKPTPTLVKRIDPLTGLEKLILDDGEEDIEQKPAQLSPEELRAKAQKDRGEKQRRYDEARARILGTPSGTSTPGTVTPPTGEGEVRSARSKGRGRGGGGNGQNLENRRPDSRSGNKELFDPNYTPKPGAGAQKRNAESSRSGRSTPREDEQIIRAPRGPDAFGKGFGFAKRGDTTG